jgi:hypothetical protein
MDLVENQVIRSVFQGKIFLVCAKDYASISGSRYIHCKYLFPMSNSILGRFAYVDVKHVVKVNSHYTIRIE